MMHAIFKLDHNRPSEHRLWKREPIADSAKLFWQHHQRVDVGISVARYTGDLEIKFAAFRPINRDLKDTGFRPPLICTAYRARCQCQEAKEDELNQTLRFPAQTETRPQKHMRAKPRLSAFAAPGSKGIAPRALSALSICSRENPPA